MKVDFNKPHISGNELKYIEDAVSSLHLSGNGKYTSKCHQFFEQIGFEKVLLTTSCSDALEMSAILANIEPGDEVILPSFTFTSTANAFLMRGATLRFADSLPGHPNIDPEQIAELVNENTKVVVVVHYAGVACDMDKILELCREHDLILVEDAAQSIDSYYKGKPLGSFGTFGAFSFHETKNIICGEGGMLAINDGQCAERAEIIWEKGTNRAAFKRGEVNKYEWVDIGSSFLLSELNAAFLYGQLENLEAIQHKRKEAWEYYHGNLKDTAAAGRVSLPSIPEYATNNAHLYHIMADSGDLRNQLMTELKQKEIGAVFHYLPLHRSPMGDAQKSQRELPNSVAHSERLLRLPLFPTITRAEQDHVIQGIADFLA